MVPCADAASRAENLAKKGTNPGAGDTKQGADYKGSRRL
jgi:hypothetical protein